MKYMGNRPAARTTLTRSESRTPFQELLITTYGKGCKKECRPAAGAHFEEVHDELANIERLKKDAQLLPNGESVNMNDFGGPQYVLFTIPVYIIVQMIKLYRT